MASTAVKGLMFFYYCCCVVVVFCCCLFVVCLLFYIVFIIFVVFFILEKTLPSVETCLIIDRSHQNSGSIWDHSSTAAASGITPVQRQPVTCGITAGCVCC